MLRYLTAGESHGPALTVIVEGLPAGVPVDVTAIDADLARRQEGYGRGGRMRIERDRVRVLSGLRHGRTLGSPVALLVENQDWPNWDRVMATGPVDEATLSERDRGRTVTQPRPGHADLAGALKYDHADARNVLERASARETAMRVAAGALAKQILAPFGVSVVGHVLAIGPIESRPEELALPLAELARRAEASPVRCADADASARMVAEIDAARQAGDSLGGVVEVIATGLPPGLGSHVHWDRKLDGALAAALMSVQSVKGVEVGIGFAAARRRGSEVHDEIAYDPARGYYRLSNRAGGIEGGMTTGEPLGVRMAMKPIATLYRPLRTVDMVTKEPVAASVERSDTCAVAAGAVIAECVTAFELARFWLDKFGGDSLDQVLANVRSYRDRVAAR